MPYRHFYIPFQYLRRFFFPQQSTAMTGEILAFGASSRKFENNSHYSLPLGFLALNLCPSDTNNLTTLVEIRPFKNSYTAGHWCVLFAHNKCKQIIIIIISI